MIFIGLLNRVTVRISAERKKSKCRLQADRNNSIEEFIIL